MATILGRLITPPLQLRVVLLHAILRKRRGGDAGPGLAISASSGRSPSTSWRATCVNRYATSAGGQSESTLFPLSSICSKIFLARWQARLRAHSGTWVG